MCAAPTSLEGLGVVAHIAHKHRPRSALCRIVKGRLLHVDPSAYGTRLRKPPLISCHIPPKQVLVGAGTDTQIDPTANQSEKTTLLSTERVLQLQPRPHLKSQLL